MKKNKTLRNIIIVVVIAIGALVIAKKAGWLGDDTSLKVSTEKVSPQDIVETVSANGKVQPEVEVKISSDVSGEIVEMFVKEGDVVKKGTLLCRINPEVYVSNYDRVVASLNSTRSNVESTRSRLLQAQSQFDKAKLSFDRNKKLFDDGVISANDWESVKSAYEVAKAEVDAAKQSVQGADYGVQSAAATVKEAKENLNKTTVYAPVDGTISTLSKEKGERVVGTNMMEGTEIMRLANLNEMEVNVNVGENDIVRVKMSDTALIEIDAYPDRKFKGIVTEIANSASSSNMVSTEQVTNFPVKIRILRESYADLIPAENPNASPFRPGMSATVDIQTKRVSNAMSVPIKAVTTRDTTVHQNSKARTRNEEGELVAIKKEDKKTEKKEEVVSEIVFVNVGGIAKMRPVKTGIQDNTYIEIKDGLKEGEEIITDPYNAVSKKLKDGDKVKVVDKEQLFTDQK